jgi:hypothetical protein
MFSKVGSLNIFQKMKLLCLFFWNARILLVIYTSFFEEVEWMISEKEYSLKTINV